MIRSAAPAAPAPTRLSRDQNGMIAPTCHGPSSPSMRTSPAARTMALVTACLPLAIGLADSTNVARELLGEGVGHARGRGFEPTE